MQVRVQQYMLANHQKNIQVNRKLQYHMMILYCTYIGLIVNCKGGSESGAELHNFAGPLKFIIHSYIHTTD